MVRFDFACKKCEKTFVLWSDAGKRCPYCGSVRIFKVFLTPVAASTGQASQIEKLAEQQLDAAGLSNWTNAHGEVKVTRKTDPAQIEAVAAAKANNVPFNPNIPIKTGPANSGLDFRVNQMREQYRKLGPDGVIQASGGRGGIPGPDGKPRSIVTHHPRNAGALVQALVRRGRQVDPLSGRGEKIYHKESASDGEVLQKLMKG